MKWTQKNGVKIDIKDMSTQHLRNTIAMIERNYSHQCLIDALGADAYAATAPDGAAMAAEDAATELMECADTLEGIEEWCKAYPHLCRELEKRGVPC